ncbi:YidH family protein [Paenarthrobacter ureafaciens]|uniref:YidH family protein n=1 Tax=Paenarthrobacter ureafaciens TaxID=37931 RepID=UPI0008A6C84D|nr:DUF202 domain-containing protein [Paenarthrobacter ureafaciens]AOY74192.1 Inner membrane protein [Arthrobacter sp. ZXY-2]MCX8455080.1 DUF202 domain-containing protein [Paenarthrobacter ureafaciens]MCY0974494.1 DUF202 domain-containing protein [Paenarthrobacter ureafaciens]
MAEPRRFPKAVFDQGNEPDARFSLANERTFLAWIRTALALIAGGVALEALGLGIHPGYRLAASILLILTGIMSAIQAWSGWTRTEGALRRSSPLPSTPLSLPLTVLLVSVAILILIGILLK